MSTPKAMNSTALRVAFIEFFSARGHVCVPSASLVPAEMATTLFTIAGMEPFVPIFLGEAPAPARRAVSVQRCLRVAGAKSDIENVGRTGRHGTFLEMLGNFGFADYGKAEAIQWAWDFLTKELCLDVDRLYITVHTNDNEAQELWERQIGIPSSRITRFEEDNFWTMGPTGPCGPSTEIFYDTGPSYASGPQDTGPNLGNRYVEIWNLVFQQFNREADGHLRELPALNIDTGAGLERILAVVNGQSSMYETDLFTDLIQAQPAIAQTSLPVTEHLIRQRIIADHARAVTAVIADGVHPSNTDRGYVLRFLIRRAVRNGRLLGYPPGFLTALAPAVITSLQSGFPELIGAHDRIAAVLSREEAAFEHTLARGEARLAEYLDELRGVGKTQLSGAAAFALHDTFGFPFELTREILSEQAFTVDLIGFNAEMDAQRTRARRDAAKKRGVINVGAMARLSQRSDFVGYDDLSSQGMLLEILSDDGAQHEQALTGQRVRLVLDRSSFYAERGGQIGDHGVLLGASGQRFVVDDTQMLSEAIVHHGVVEQGVFTPGQTLTAQVDADWRQEIRRHHTTAHLLQYALRQVLGEEVSQAGSWVGPERTRFDFRSPSGGLTPEQRLRVSEIINQLIRDNHEVVTQELPLAEARSLGAIAMVGESYGELVRVLRAGPSLEFCGGTHAHRTGEIGCFVLLSESSIGSGIRRIEGVVSRAAERYVQRQQNLVATLSTNLFVRPEEISERIERLQYELRERDREIQTLRAKAALAQASRLVEGAESIRGLKVVFSLVPGVDSDGLKELATALRSRLQAEPFVFVLACVSEENRLSLSIIASDRALKLGVNAGQLVKLALPFIDGKGGGGAGAAQGGGSRPAGYPQAEDAIRTALQQI